MALDSTARLVLQFELVDKATAQATANLQKIQGQAKQANSEMQKGFSVTDDSLKTVERSLSSVSRATAVLGAAIAGPLVLAVNSASKSNYDLFHAQNLIKDSMDNLFKSIGASMVPVMQTLAIKIQDGVKWWTDLDKVQKDNIIQTAAWTAGALLAVAAVTKLAAAALKLIEAWDKWAKFLVPGGAILGGLAALVTISAALVDHWARLNGQLLTASQRWERIKQFAAFAVNPIGGLVGAATRAGTNIGNRMFGGAGTEGNPVNLGAISASRGASQSKKQLDDLAKHASSVADEIGSRFQIMSETYMRSLQGIAGVTMTVITTTIDGVTKGLGDSLAQAIVQGKNFAESMKAALKSLAEQIISFLVSTIAKITVLRALGVVGPIYSGALGLGGGGSGGGEGGSGGGGGGVGSFFKRIFGFSQGGTISEPIVGMGMRSGAGYTFAERGPETITPGFGGPRGGGNNITISVTGNTVRNDRDLDELTYRISRNLRMQTRLA